MMHRAVRGISRPSGKMLQVHVAFGLRYIYAYDDARRL